VTSEPTAPGSEPAAARRAAGAVAGAAALFAAVVIQLTVVNRLPLPGSAAPDLVLLLVTAIAVVTGPATGAAAGFAGGLALDIAPPAAHYAGEYALVFCLAGYGTARAVRAIWDLTGERDPVTSFAVMAAAAAAGEAGKAALGLLLSEPDVTAAAVSRVLPAAILCDLVLSPVVFWLVCLASQAVRSWGAAAPEHAPLPEFSRAQRLTMVFRQASAGAAPNLRLAGSGQNFHRPSTARPLPRLRLSDSRSPAAARTGAGGTHGARVPVAGARARKLNFAGDLTTGAAAGRGPRRANVPGKNWLRAGGPSAHRAAAPRAPCSPSRGWLGSPGAGPRGGRAASGSGLAGPRRSADAVLAARSAPSGLSALSGAGTPLGRRRRSPQAGWLRSARSAGPSLTASGQRLAPRRGWLGSGRPRTVIGSGVTGRGAVFRRGSVARRNWYTASPSRAWLKRSRHPWRRRRQRLLRMVGVGR
jgi:rod shape-determining protein MreD